MQVIVAALVFCADGHGQSRGGIPEAAETQPATTQPIKVETVAEARARLTPPKRSAPTTPARTRRGRGRSGRQRPAAPEQPAPEPPRKLSPEDIALLAALDLTLALGRADGAAAASLIDAVGYQPLPRSGELPEPPPKPVLREQVQSLVAARTAASLGELPASGFMVLKRDALREQFPAVAAWMLPTDLAVVIEPSTTPLPWVKNRCCLIIRLRAQKPAILGGNLLEALEDRD